MPWAAEELATCMQHWNERARRAILDQLGGAFGRHRLVHFSEEEAAVLRALLSHMIPQPEGEEVDFADFLDWAIDKPLRGAQTLPEPVSPKDFIRAGLLGVQETAVTRYGRAFVELAEEQQELVLSQVRAGVAEGEIWKQVPPRDFLVHVLTRALAGYCAHPFARLRGGVSRAGWSTDYGWTSRLDLPVRRWVPRD